MPFKDPEYKRFRQQQPDLFIKETYRTVPLKNTNYRGKKFAWFMTRGNALAIIGVMKKNRDKRGPRGGKIITIQSILIPVNELKKVE